MPGGGQVICARGRAAVGHLAAADPVKSLLTATHKHVPLQPVGCDPSTCFSGTARFSSIRGACGIRAPPRVLEEPCRLNAETFFYRCIHTRTKPCTPHLAHSPFQ